MERKPVDIQAVTPRETVEIHLPDGRTYSGKRGTPIGKFLEILPENDQTPIVGAVINGELRELTYSIDMDARVRPVTMADSDGALIYRRSLTFLLEAAFQDLFALDSILTVDHSVSSGGFYCRVTGRDPLSQDEVIALESRMHELVEMDLPFERRNVPLTEAIAFFESKGQADKVCLLKFRQKDRLVLYRLEDHQDYHHGYMLPSTGFIRWFKLILLGEGFALQFPHRHAPKEILPMPAYPKLLATFQQYGNWLTRLGIESVGSLNEAIQAGRLREVILVSEALHEQKIAEIARQVVDRSDRARIVLIAGPSSSGKTTFSKRLSVQLLAYGLSPFPLELDNYFVNREQTPRDANGDYDYEALQALNIELLQSNLKSLIAGDEVQLPRFNFRTGSTETGEVVRLNKDQLIILEGIHGLNPGLLPEIDPANTYRLYVSCLTQLNLDRHNRISTTDTRLLRRIARDARDRGYNARQTIQRWDSVRRGEKKHIFPYQENADEFFNSALVYEVSALKLLAEPLLRQVPFGVPEYIEAKRLLTFLEWFLPVEEDSIPDNSILREFIGKSILKTFKLWD